MTRAQLWAALDAALPGIRRVVRADPSAPAIVMAEDTAPRPDHKYDDLTLTIVLPVRRLPGGLDDDPGVAALCRACDGLPMSYRYALGYSDDWGGAVYTVTIEAVVTRHA